MKVEFANSFLRDARKIKDDDIKLRIRNAVREVEKASTLKEISAIIKLKGRKNKFRIRIGDYRIGLFIEGNKVQFVRVLHRRDMYGEF